MLIAANWKAYVEDATRAKTLFSIAKRLAKKSGYDIVLAPPAPLLGTLARGNRSSVAFAAQDVSHTTGGAQTGEVTAQAYAAARASYAIVGHSERRRAGGTNEIVAEKLAHALAHGLTPILCVGERARDGEGRDLAFVRDELASALEPLTPKERVRVIIAYEPIWAIGKTAADAINPADLTEMVLYLRKVLAGLLPGKGSSRAQVLYGGSVEPSGVRDLTAGSGVDGVLVGHASVDPNTFAALIQALI